MTYTTSNHGGVLDSRLNSSDYNHPRETNLLNLHKAMQYRDGTDPPEPEIRVNVGNGFVISGNVNIPGTVTVNSSPDNPVHTHITEVGTSGNLLANNISYMPIGGNVLAFQGTSPWVMTGNIIVDSGNIIITQLPNVTVNSIIANVNVNPITGNVSVTQGTTPWVTTATITGGVITPIAPDVEVTAFEEPLAVGITPIIQADVTYGIDPDFWVTTKLNGGNVVATPDNVWQVSSGTSAGGYARLATSKYMTYQPGQGSMFRWTAAFTTLNNANTKAAFGINNIVQNTGPLDREDGYGIGFSGATDSDAHKRIGILHRRAGRAETRSFTVTVAPTGAQTAVFTLNSVAYTISLTASTDVNYTANQIADRLKAIDAARNTWDIEGCNGVVTFTYYSPGPKTGTYSFSCTGTGTLCAGTLAQVAAGVTPIDSWTYVDSWDNQDIQFDPSKLNVFGLDFRWLGAGRVRFFMEDPATGRMVLVHTLKWSSQYLVPHLTKPSLRLIYRSGTTNSAVTPSQNVVITGASVFAGVQGIINQTGSSQGAYNVDSTTRSKDTVYHLMSVANPYVRNGGVNKASLAMQTLTVAAQGNDPSVIFIVKNATGLSDTLVFQAIPNTTVAMFAQYSISSITENLSVDRICNVQTLGINGTATFDLKSYNLNIAPGETVSVFISSTNAINRTAIGLTWNVD